MLRLIYEWTLSLAASRHAVWALAGVSFVESSFFPIPPDALLVPMIIADPRRAWYYALVATVASVAGGFLGYLARTGRTDEQALRRAAVYGSTLGSFAVERFSIDRLMEIHRVDIARRLEDFRRLVAFEEEVDT